MLLTKVPILLLPRPPRLGSPKFMSGGKGRRLWLAWLLSSKGVGEEEVKVPGLWPVSECPPPDPNWPPEYPEVSHEVRLGPPVPLPEWPMLWSSMYLEQNKKLGLEETLINILWFEFFLLHNISFNFEKKTEGSRELFGHYICLLSTIKRV